jgi:hypothetical protein
MRMEDALARYYDFMWMCDSEIANISLKKAIYHNKWLIRMQMQLIKRKHCV